MIGQRIKQVRLESGLTQEDFGKRIGLKKSAVSMIEKSNRDPSAAVIKAVASEFMVNEDWLITGLGPVYDKAKQDESRLVEDYAFATAMFNDEFKEFGQRYKSMEILDRLEVNTAFWSLTSILNKAPKANADEYFEAVASMLSEIERFISFCSTFSSESITGIELLTIIHKYAQSVEDDLKTAAETFFEEKCTKCTGYAEQDAELVRMSQHSHVSVLGKVAAGKPIEAVNTADDLMVLSGTSKADFALKIRGDSMEPQIMDGSTVLVVKQEVIETGQIGIFSINGEVTCKRAVVTEGRLELHSFNRRYNPIIVNEADQEDMDVVVIGRVLLDEE